MLWQLLPTEVRWVASVGRGAAGRPAWTPAAGLEACPTWRQAATKVNVVKSADGHAESVRHENRRGVPRNR